MSPDRGDDADDLAAPLSYGNLDDARPERPAGGRQGGFGSDPTADEVIETSAGSGARGSETGETLPLRWATKRWIRVVGVPTRRSRGTALGLVPEGRLGGARLCGFRTTIRAGVDESEYSLRGRPGSWRAVRMGSPRGDASDLPRLGRQRRRAVVRRNPSPSRSGGTRRVRVRVRVRKKDPSIDAGTGWRCFTWDRKVRGDVPRREHRCNDGENCHPRCLDPTERRSAEGRVFILSTFPARRRTFIFAP